MSDTTDAGTSGAELVPDRRGFWVAVIAATLLAALLRGWGLEHQAIWEDEGYTMLLARRPIPEIIEGARQDVHPPGYYILLRGWTRLFGTSVSAHRALSALAGVLCVPFAAALGLALGGRSVGATTAALIAFSPVHVHYSQEIRMYSLLALLCTVSTWALWRAAHADRGVGWWTALAALAGGAALWTHYVAWLFPAAQLGGLLALGHLRLRRRVLLAGVCGVLLLALIAPWLPSLLAQQGHVQDILNRPQSPVRLVAAYVVLLVGYTQARSAFFFGTWQAGAAVAVGAAVLAALLLLGWRHLYRSRRPAALFLAGLILVPPVAFYLLCYTRQTFLTYVLLPVAVPLIIAVAAGCVSLGRRGAPIALGAALAISAVSLIVYLSLPMFNRGTGLKHAAALLRQRLQPGDIVCHQAETTKLALDAYLMDARGRPSNESLLLRRPFVAPGWDYWPAIPDSENVGPWIREQVSPPGVRNLWLVTHQGNWGGRFQSAISAELGPHAERYDFPRSHQTGGFALHRWPIRPRPAPPPDDTASVPEGMVCRAAL